MKHMMKMLSAAVTVLTLLFTNPGGGRVSRLSDTQAILDAEHTWIKAIETNNRIELEKILSNSFTDISWDGHLRTKDTVLAELGMNRKEITSQAFSDWSVSVYGYVGIVRGLNTVHGKSFGTVNVRFTDVFVKHKGHFEAVAAQETLVR